MDRIDDAYNGLMGDEFMRKTRERLHWMCSKVQGAKILDVGCSQGTLARILGSLGKNVQAVDINSDAIAFAGEKLAEMDSATRNRVRFLALNFMDFKTDERYDSVVIGEVLEHLVCPEAFVEKAYGHLVEDGVIVITVPFGINDDPDHRHTFYWSWINEIVSPCFDIREFRFFGKWIGVVGVKREKKAVAESSIPFSVVKDLEAAFYAIERPIVNDNKTRGERIKALSAAHSAELAKQKEALSKAAAEKKEAVEAAAKQKTVLEGEIARQRTALAAEQSKAQDLTSKLMSAHDELSAIKNEALELRVNRDAEQRVAVGQTEQIAVLKAALQYVANRQQPESAEMRLLEYSREMRELRSAFDAKRDELTERAERMGRLAGEVEALKESRDSLSLKVEELSASLAEATSVLESKEEAMKRLAEAYSELEKELADKKDTLRKLEEERQLIQSALSVAEGEAVSARSETEVLKSEADRLEADLARAHRENENLRRKVDTQQEALDSQKAAAAKCNSELAQTRSSLAAEQKKTEEVKAALDKTVAELKAKESQATSLQNQNCRISQEKDRAKRKFEVERKRYDMLAKSKLGRLTLKYWRWKDGVKAKKVGDIPQFELQYKEGKQRTEGSKNLDKATENLSADSLAKGDEGFFDRVSASIAGMPESNGSRYYEKLDVTIGIICDQFYWDSICSAADFKYISPSVTEEELSKLDCMLVVSAWTGLKNEEWRGISTERRPMRIRAEEIIDICRKRKVPTIFYSKEDPPNYDLYVGLAQKCDFVFTSAAECILDYKRDCGHDRVYAMKFCINPTVHNPVGMRYAAKERNVIFSGSWMEKYPHRCKDLDTIFTGILQSGRELNIVDRNYALRGNPMYRYPEKYRKFQSPAIDHASLLKVHKLFDWAVNINTVKDSATMFANRVYELQASGNLLLSNYSVGVSNLLPTVFLVHESDEAARMLTSFTDEEVYERQVSGVRRVMSGETCYDRISEMLSLAGIRKEVLRRRVLVIVDKMSDRVRSMFDRQSYEGKEILEISQVTDQIYADADIIAFFREDYEYGVFYLEDMVNGFKYTDCDYITKDAYLNNGKIKKGVEHAYVDLMRDRYRTVFWRKAFDRTRLIKMRGKMTLPNGYSIDHFNVDVKPCRAERTKPEVSVIIPTYNNGWFLYGRSFASLRRSSIFDKMEIIIVDDGSPDGFTPKMGTHLESLYPNVRTFHFPTGGSGTAARPRNKGLSLAGGSYVMFIDPDDAAIDDGFAKLYFSAHEDASVDVVYGDIIKFSGDEHIIERAREKLHGLRAVDYSSPLRRLLDENFMPINTMSMVLRNAFIQKNNLRQTEGGMGEDSLFSQQVFALAGKSRYEPVLTLFYYAERTDSVCNTIDPVFFDKYILTERDRVSWLNNVGLFQEYVQKRLAPYVIGWYFKKLGIVAPENREACCRKVMEILSLYGSGNPSGNTKIGKFMDVVSKGDVAELFGTVIPLPVVKNSGKRVEVLPPVAAFCLPLDKKFVRYTCSVEKKSMVFVSGALECAGIQSDLEKSSIMCVLFEDSSKKPLPTTGLSHSPKFGDYIYLTAGAGAARGFRQPIRVPENAVRLTLAFVRWAAKGELRLSDLKVVALEP